MTTQDDRRHFWRAHFHSPVQLVLHGKVVEAGLVDISLKGALVEVAPGWHGQMGDHCHIRLALAANATIQMSVRITHIDGQCIGLHCENIDVDSITHLRRLVELNAGDPGLLDRELSALLHESS